jgi:hypothetical protein
MDAEKTRRVVKRIIVGTVIIIITVIAAQRSASWLGLNHMSPPKGLKVYVQASGR